MIASYTPPQLTITQRLQQVSGSSAPRLGGCLIGPKYLLSRHGKETVPGTVFNTAGQTLPWEYFNAAGVRTVLPADHAVDLDLARLYGEGLEASLATFAYNGTPHFNLDSLLTPNVIKISTTRVQGGTLATLLRGRPVKVGDLVYVTDNLSAVRKRTVAGLRGVAVASSYGTNNDKNDTFILNSAYNPATEASVTTPFVLVTSPAGLPLSVVDVTDFNATVRGSRLGNRYGEEFTVTVRTSGLPGIATVDIASASGLWAATNVATADSSGDFSITNSAAGGELAGLDLLVEPTVASTPLTQGQVFKFRVFQPYVRLDKDNFAIGDYGSGYTGAKDTTYEIKVVQGSSGDTFIGGKLRITDSMGLDQVTDVTITSNTQVIQMGTLGLKLTLAVTTPSWEPQSGLRAGDTYYIHAKAPSESTTEFDKVVLDGPAVDTTVFTDISVGVGVEFRLGFSGQILRTDAVDENAWTANSSGQIVDAGLSLYVSDRSSTYQWVPYTSAVGKLYSYWRAVVPVGQTEPFVTVTSTDDIVALLGTIDPDNVAAFGAFEALGASAGAQISVQCTNGTDLEAFSEALAKLEATDDLYYFGILTEDPAIKQVAKVHVNEMSSPTKMNFRRVYTGVNSPGDYPVAVEDGDGNDYFATIGDYGGQNLLVTHTSATLDFTLLNIGTGDLIRLPGSNQEFVINSILSSSELLLKAGPTFPVSPAVPFEVWKNSSALSQAAFVKATAQALANRRVISVWQESGTRIISGTTPTVINNIFTAAYIVGLRTGLRPQQGITRQAVTSITSAPAMHTKYRPAVLDDIAANGTMIIAQNVEGGLVFVRHQLTTDVNNGILYYEDSPGIIVDYLSLRIKDQFDPYVGKRNVNRRTLELIEAGIVNLLEQEKLVDLDADYGPLIIDYDNLSVAADAVLKDRVNVKVRVFIPLPLNTLAVEIEGSVQL